MSVKNIPLAVNRRLSDISSSQAIFEAAIPPYQEALKKAGHKHKLSYIPPSTEEGANQPRRRCRSKRVVWFNPPFNKGVKTNVATTFLQIIEACFPPGHPSTATHPESQHDQGVIPHNDQHDPGDLQTQPQGDQGQQAGADPNAK